jgi:hypothetical protein
MSFIFAAKTPGHKAAPSSVLDLFVSLGALVPLWQFFLLFFDRSDYLY